MGGFFSDFEEKILKSWHLLLQSVSILCSSLKCFDIKFYIQPGEWVECTENSFPPLNFIAIAFFTLLAKLSVHVFLYVIFVYVSQQQNQNVPTVKKPKKL